MIRVLLGCTVLLAGKNIFWLFIAVIGFLLGAELAQAWLGGQPVLQAFCVYFPNPVRLLWRMLRCPP